MTEITDPFEIASIHRATTDPHHEQHEPPARTRDHSPRLQHATTLASEQPPHAASHDVDTPYQHLLIE